MKFGRPLLILALLLAAYVGVLAYLDHRNHRFDNLVAVREFLPVLVAMSLASYVVRYARWKWLLGQHGFAVPWLSGLLPYLAGFALAASPGRVGELVRIRYVAALSIPAQPIVACFIFERGCDLVIILLLASLIGDAWSGFWAVAAFVTLVIAAIAAVVVLSRSTKAWGLLAHWLRTAQWRRTARAARTLGDGISRTAMFLNPVDIAGSIAFGIVAWGLQALGFVYLTTALGLVLPLGVALAIFPLAAMIGTASMLPGGIGAAEAALAFLLIQFGAPLEVAAFAAVAMRLCTHWLVIACGLISAAVLEICPPRTDRVGKAPKAPAAVDG